MGLNNNDTCTEATLALLREQDALCERLEALADRQHRVIADDDSDRLMSVLSEREAVAEGLSRLASRLAPRRQEWARYRDQLDEERREEVDCLLARTRARLSRLMACDDRDARLLEARSKRVGVELQASFRGGRAVQAYGEGHLTGGRLDRTVSEPRE